MNFVYPNFLWALLLLLIPVIIHLFNFRRYKTIYFSRVKHLQEVVEDSKSGTKLKHLLVLFSRMLALSCLVLAFAQPFIPSEEGDHTENLTSIYIDNSYSMQAEGNDGDLLNEVKNQAIEIVHSLEENERINLITSDLLSIHQRFYSKSEVIDMIKAIDYSAKSTTLESAIRVQLDLLNNQENAGNKRLFLLSDFQKTASTLTALDTPGIPTYLYKANAILSENIFIDSVWFETPVHKANTPVDVFFRARNNSDKDQNELTVRLAINGNEPGPKKISIPANSFVDEKITFTDRTAGNKEATISIATSQLFFDDDFHFSYTIKEQVEILVVRGKNDDQNNIEQLYGLDTYYNYTATSIDRLTQEDMDSKELIVIQNVDRIPGGITELLNDAIKNGATVVLIPGTNPDKSQWNTYLSSHNLPALGNTDTSSAELSYFNSDDPIYSGVFEQKPENYRFPQLYRQNNLQIGSSQNFITLFGTNPSTPFLLYGQRGNGKLILLSGPLHPDHTNFQSHALFAATFLRIAETASFNKPLYSTIGKMDNFPIQQVIDEKNPIHLINEEFGVDVIPQFVNISNSRFISFSHLEDALKVAGFYDLTNSDNYNETLALNYDRRESDVSTFELEAIKNEFISQGWENVESFDLTVDGKVEINQLKAREYWRILLILALIFIAIEILLLKLWKR